MHDEIASRRGLRTAGMATMALLALALLVPPTYSQTQAAGAGQPAAARPPAWLYPAAPAGAPPRPPDAVQLHHLPGNNLAFTMAQITNRFGPADWHPRNHPPMPQVVAHGYSPEVWACSFCHLPNGQGRPDNSSLAGLSVDYFTASMADFKSGARRGTDPALTGRMAAIARAMSVEQVRAAAAYFASIPFRPWVRVEESATAPSYRFVQRMMIPTSGREPLGQRIVEVPVNPALAALRDDESGMIAYVPPGSIAAGRALASGTGGIAACSSCHGAGLRGTALAPPLAGRSPTSTLRELYDFKDGAFGGPLSAQMRPIVENLDLSQMMALAAYSASLHP